MATAVFGRWIFGWAAAPLLWVMLTQCASSPADSKVPASATASATTSAVVDIPYGREPSEHGELRLPDSTAAAPVVVVLHGGCWQAQVAGLDHIGALAEALRQAGYATWNVEYRRLGEAGGGWPGTFADVGTALDFVRTLHQRFPGRLDTTRVVVLGHSAGAHLACWLAARPRIASTTQSRSAEMLALIGKQKPFRPAGVVSLDGPADLREFEELGGLFCGSGIGARLVGGSVREQPQRWHLASPADWLPWGVPCRVMVGTDGMMPLPASQLLVKRAQAAGDARTALVVLPGIDHFALIDPTTSAGPAIRAAIEAVLAQ